MNERQKETKFLKTLILCDDSDQGRQLQDKIKSAEKDERCIRCAINLVILLGLLSLSGLGYSAVFVPQIARFSSHIATRIFCVLGLGTVICLGLFLGYWFWFRAVSNRVYEDCRRFLRATLEARLTHSALSARAVRVETATVRVYRSETPQSQDDTDFFQLSKAS